MNRPRLLKSSVNVSVLRLLGQVFALFSGLLIANFFGASTATDDYYTALILPSAIGNLIINALTNLFAPIYLKYFHDDPEQANDILSSMTLVVALALLIGTVICLLAVPLVTSLRSISGEAAAARALTFGFLLVINCPLVGLARLLGVYSEAQQHYNIPAAVAILNPLIFIGTLIVTLPLGIYSLLIANLTASVVEVCILFVYALRNLNLHIRWRTVIHPAVKEMLQASFAPGVAFLALMLVPTVDRFIASTLDAGSLTAFHYGDRIVVAFETLVAGGPLLIIRYHWANINAQQDIRAVAHSVSEVFSLTNYTILPICAAGAALSYPLISILFGRGAFDAVGMSANVFAVLLLSELFYFWIVLVFYLMLLVKQTTAQAVMCVGVFALNLVFNLLLVPFFNLNGIVISTLVTRMLVASAGVYWVKRNLPNVALRPMLVNGLWTLACISVMLIWLAAVQQLLMPLLTREYGLLQQVLGLAFAAVTAGAVFLGVSFLLRHPEFMSLKDLVMKLKPREKQSWSGR